MNIIIIKESSVGHHCIIIKNPVLYTTVHTFSTIFMRGSPISYENWAPGVPKIILTWGLGSPNSYEIGGGPGVPKIGGPQSHMTPAP